MTIWFEIYLIETLYRRHLMLGLVFHRDVTTQKTVWIVSPNEEHPESVHKYGNLINRVSIFETRELAQSYVDEEHDNYVCSKLTVAGKTTGTQRGSGRKIIADMREMVRIRRWKVTQSTITKRW